jgi:uncharacterized protein (DUF488 family)
MPKNLNKNSRQFPTAKTAFFSLFTVIFVLIAAFPKLYEIKTKAGIDISKGRHAGTFFEKHTNGLFKCEWLYPYHCDRTKS